MSKKINLIPMIYAGDISNEVEEEFTNREVSTHYQSDVVFLDWEEDEDWGYPIFKQWLIETYGEEIKQYGQFAIQAT